jgi:hypothetical protein
VLGLQEIMDIEIDHRPKIAASSSFATAKEACRRRSRRV